MPGEAPQLHYHYVTARSRWSILIKAAEAGWQGQVAMLWICHLVSNLTTPAAAATTLRPFFTTSIAHEPETYL